MKKLFVLILSIVSMCQIRAENQNLLQQSLTNLTTTLQSLNQSVQRIGTKRPLPPGPTQPITEQEKQQLVNVLKDLDLEDKATVIDQQEITPADFLGDLKLALNEILKGFDLKTGAYIGYPNNKKEFLARYLADFDVALKFLRVTAPQDPDIAAYEGWRPHLQDAVGKLPVKPNGAK